MGFLGWLFSIATLVSLMAFNLYAIDSMMRLRADVLIIKKTVTRLSQFYAGTDAAAPSPQLNEGVDDDATGLTPNPATGSGGPAADQSNDADADADIAARADANIRRA